MDVDVATRQLGSKSLRIPRRVVREVPLRGAPESVSLCFGLRTPDLVVVVVVLLVPGAWSRNGHAASRVTLCVVPCRVVASPRVASRRVAPRARGIPDTPDREKESTVRETVDKN